MNEKRVILSALVVLMCTNIMQASEWSEKGGSQSWKTGQSSRGPQRSYQEHQNKFDTHERERKELGKISIIYAAGKGELRTVEDWLNGTIRGSLTPAELLLLKDKHESTALTWAAGEGEHKVVELLLNAGERAGVLRDMLLASNKDGETALTWAASRANLEVVKLLLKAGEKAGVLHYMLQASNKDGETALTWAASRANLEVVRSLLNAGEKAGVLGDMLLASTNNRSTALTWAGKADVVELLLNAGERAGVLRNMLQASTNNGSTALTWAANEGKAEIVGLLLSSARSLHDRTLLWSVATHATKEGKTTLMQGSIAVSASIVREILRAASESKPNDAAFAKFINAQDHSIHEKTGNKRLRTAIHWAIRLGEGSSQGEKKQHSSQEIRAVIQEILKYNVPNTPVNITLLDARGKTPIYWAAYHELKDVLEDFEKVARLQKLNRERFFQEIASGENDKNIAPELRYQSSSSSSSNK